MPIRTTDEPEGAGEIIARAIVPLSGGGSGIGDPHTFVSGHVGDVDDQGDPGDLGVFAVKTAAPHAVYVAGLRGIADHGLLRAAQRKGWRYLVLHGEEVVGTATVRHDARSDSLVFSHLTRGPSVASTVQAIGAAEAAPEAVAADFEPRLLDIPGIHLRAIWLHAKDADLLVPIAPAPGGIQPNRVYTESALLPVVRTLAERAAGQAADAGG
jgi:hypothetical protein